jgi:hypothetical protein
LFYITWLPTYLRETRGLELNQNAFTQWLGQVLGSVLAPDTTQKVLVAALAGVPLFVGGLGCVVSGWATPRLIRLTRSVAGTRKLLALTGFTGASALLVASFHIRIHCSPCWRWVWPASATIHDAGELEHLHGPRWPVRRHSFGSMNMMGAGWRRRTAGHRVHPDATARDWPDFLIRCDLFSRRPCWLWIDPVTPIEHPKLEWAIRCCCSRRMRAAWRGKQAGGHAAISTGGYAAV